MEEGEEEKEEEEEAEKEDKEGGDGEENGTKNFKSNLCCPPAHCCVVKLPVPAPSKKKKRLSPLKISYICENLWHLSFCVWCISLNVLSSRFIHVATTNRMSPFQKSESLPLYIHDMFSFQYLFFHWWMLG